jgi:2-deoxy-D-gluconate 3-dehydrogenase
MAKHSIDNLFSLIGKVAIVTGGSKGIGRATAERLAEAGASVVIADIDEHDAKLAIAAIEEAGGRASFIKTDCAKVDDARRLVDGTLRLYNRVDILVNNAGIFPMCPALEVREELWDRVLDLNLKGAFFLAQAVARRMQQDGHGGAIVNIASIDALHPSGALVHYDSSKGGMLMMTRSLAAELGKSGVRVNAICPGGINTPGAGDVTRSVQKSLGLSGEQMTAGFLSRIPLGRMGEPDDIACAVLFLASNASAYMTGAVMVVDGGYLVA